MAPSLLSSQSGSPEKPSSSVVPTAIGENKTSPTLTAGQYFDSEAQSHIIMPCKYTVYRTLCPAVFQERLKASEHRSEMEDKADKRNTDPKPRPSSISSSSPSPVLHPRKPLPPSHSPTPSTSSLTPLPPLPSPVTTLKSEEGGQRVLAHPPMPLPHPPSPRSASPPPSSPRQPKQEVAEEGEVGRREQREGQKPASAPFQAIYSGES